MTALTVNPLDTPVVLIPNPKFSALELHILREEIHNAASDATRSPGTLGCHLNKPTF